MSFDEITIQSMHTLADPNFCYDGVRGLDGLGWWAWFTGCKAGNVYS